MDGMDAEGLVRIGFVSGAKRSGSTTSHSDLSLPNYESFFFDIDHQEEKSSGSTTSQSNHSLSEYEAFCFDHQEEKRSGSTTSHSDPSFLEYESFYFNLSIDTLPLADRSDSHYEEFADELAHIISLPDDIFFLKDSSEIDPSLSFHSGNEDKVFDPGIFIINEIHSFTRKFSRLPNDNFKIDKRDIFL
nr:hypothetical protein [Tanacetum cinerariifolium]